MASSDLASAGLDSLTSIRIASQLARSGQRSLDAATILECRTPNDLEALLRRDTCDTNGEETTTNGLTDSDLLSLSVKSHDLLADLWDDIECISPCTQTQSAMLSMTAQDPQAYCNWVDLVAAGSSVHDVKTSLQSLASCHELLRAGFLALSHHMTNHALIVWTALEDSQISIVGNIGRRFIIHSDADLLRPCSFQLKQSDDGVHIRMFIHHALYDQWSIDILRSDLAKLLRGSGVEARPSFRTVIRSKSKSKARVSSEKSLEFWQDHLRDCSPTPFPFLIGKRVDAGLQRTDWQNTGIRTDRLRLAAKAFGTSSPAIYQAAMAYLLSTYIGKSDVVYGTVFSGRHIPVNGIESIFGPCLATLPARVDIANSRTCLDLVRGVHDRSRLMLKHSETPLTAIKSAAELSENTSLFDTLFVWQESTITAQEPQSVVKEVGSEDHHEFSLVVEVDPADTFIAIRVTYRRQLITPEQVNLFVRQLEGVVQLILNDPDTEVEQISMQLPTTLLSIANACPSSSTYRSQGLISDIERKVRQHPSAPALMFATDLHKRKLQVGSISYETLNNHANGIAHLLLSMSVSPNDLVCICMEKSPQLYAAILGTLKAGAGYVPLVPETPRERMKDVIAQAGVSICLSDKETAPRLRDIPGMKLISLTEQSLAGMPIFDPALPYVGSNVAYAVFTSGSTGRPKGVVVTFGNLYSNLQTLAKIYPVADGDRLLQACSQAFDVSVFEIFFAFFTGICLCSATKDTLFADLERSIQALGITHLSMTPTVAALVDPANVPTVRFLVTAGEGVTDLVHRQWAGKGLHQGYGPSETTNICTINANMTTDDLLGNIGSPLSNTSAFVFAPGDGFRLLPAGAVGEFAFGGEQVFRGYLGMDDLNSQKIIDHPEFGRIYRSGDLGRILCDGTLLITGRLDDQVKIRGNRVELGEINSIVLKNPAVHDCTASVMDSIGSDQTPVAFWTPKYADKGDFAILQPSDSIRNTVAELFVGLEEALPAYMVPTGLIPVTKLPLTSQGKLDKRCLQKLWEEMCGNAKAAFSRTTEPETDDSECTGLESNLAQALADTLALPQKMIARNTNFFAAGLNSINAIRFAKAVEIRTGSPVSISAVLRNPSIAKLSRIIEGSSPTESAATVDDLLDVFDAKLKHRLLQEAEEVGQVVENILPCTPLQEAMLSASSAEGSAAYCSTTTFKVTGELQKLQDCFAAVVSRHAILRTRFVDTQDSRYPYAQVVVKSGLEFSRDTTAEKKPQDELSRSSQPSANAQPIDRFRPVRIEVHATGSATHLLLHMHHAVYDGVAMSNILSEVEALYHGHNLLAPTSFHPFLCEVLKQNEQSAIDFWSSRIGNFQPLPFPNNDRSEKKARQTQITAQLCVNPTEVDKFCKRHCITQASVFHAAWAKVLFCAQRSRDICFGDVVSGRSVAVADVERLVAPCFNTIPVRIDSTASCSNINLMQQLHGQRLDAVPYQLTSLRRIQTLSASPSLRLFDSVLLLQPPEHELDADIWCIEEEVGTMDLPLTVEVTPQDFNYQIILHFASDLVSAELATTICHAIEASLLSCLRYPSSNISDFKQFDTNSISGTLTSRTKHADSQMNGHPPPAEDVGDHWTAEEVLVRRAFAELARVDPSRLRRDTSMHQLGLDSLNAMQVAKNLQSRGLDVSAADVMEHPTVSALARTSQHPPRTVSTSHTPIYLEEYDKQHRQQLLTSTQVDATKLDAVRPCTAAQNGMVAQSVSSQGQLYINHITHQIPGSVNKHDITRCWIAVQRKHQALRMGFAHSDDPQAPYMMIIYREDAVAAPVLELGTRLTLDEIETAAQGVILDTLHMTAWRVSLATQDGLNVMVLSLHHALYDAESLQVILADFAAALQHLDLGHAQTIDPLLRSVLNASHHSSDAAEFWRSLLDSASITKFPNLMPSATVGSGLSSVEQTGGLSRPDLEKFCSRKSCTMQALGQSAWATLLAAYIGEPRVTFGTVFSGRATSVERDIVFPNISTIPVVCDTNQPFSDVLDSMVTYNAAVQRHRAVPLSDIQRYANCAEQALFDTVFVYQKTSSVATTSLDWPIIRETAGVDYSVSLELEVAPDESIKLKLTYEVALLPQRQAYLMLEQYENILSDVLHAHSPSKVDADLYSIMPPKQPTLPSTVSLLHQFVERGAQRHHNRLALEFVYSSDSSDDVKSGRWTYRELDQISNQVAHMIQKIGVKPGSIIALCMNKCPEASFAFVGISKAGCSFLALDPELPSARHEFILKDSNASLVFADASTHQRLASMSANVVHLTTESVRCFQATSVKSLNIDPDSASYCLYTSGTTGQPKGCIITHRNVVQFLTKFQRLFAGHWHDNSRWLQFASYWFDVSVMEQFWSWSVGINVISAPRDLVLSDLAGFIARHKVTHIDLTPSLARLLHPDEVPSLCDGVFITGGEPLKQEIIDTWGPHRVICNGYGPTETTIGVTMNPFVGTNAKPSNIGTQFDNVGTYVLKPGTDEPVLRGAIGELCVTGTLVGQGYLNRPDLTAQQFPHLDRFGERVYRTGDLVRILADGSFSFIGRKDSQAKLRGQRLETSEIDAVIKASTIWISDVATMVIKAQGDKELLVSFITHHTGRRTLDLEAIHGSAARSAVGAAESACRGSLPGYMVPTHVVPITAIPLTVNNKLDGKRLSALFDALPLKQLQSLKQHGKSLQPVGPTEHKIIAILSKILSFETKGIDKASNIFSIGLSSISAITFTSLLKRAGFAGATVAIVMRNPTLGQLAAALSSGTEDTHEDERSTRQATLSLNAFSRRNKVIAARRLSIEIEDIEAVAPCTPLQQGLLVESSGHADGRYFNVFRFRLLKVDTERLKQAFTTLTRSLQVLRTQFLQSDEGHMQVVTCARELQWYVSKVVEGHVDAYVAQKRHQWVSSNGQEVHRPFEVHIIQTQKGCEMHIFIHHALYDGISWDLLLDRLARIYHTGRQVNCGPNFIDALPCGPLREQADAKKFWPQTLGEGACVPLPKPSMRPQTAALVLHESLGDASDLETARKRVGVSHQAILQACFSVALHQFAPETQAYGSVVSGRSIALERAEEVIGPLFNTIPFPVDLRPADTWYQYTQRIHNNNVSTLPFQHTSLRDIRTWCGREPSDPMFDCLFVFQHETTKGQESSTELWVPLEAQPQPEYPVAVEIVLNGKQQLAITIVSQPDAADDAMLSVFLDHFRQALKCIVSNSDNQISDVFDIAPNDQRSQTNGHLNGGPELNGVHKFEWTSAASLLRDQIAGLAAVDNDVIDEHSTFFSCGLDSIDAVKLSARLKKYGMSITVGEILRAQTIPRILQAQKRQAEEAATKPNQVRLKDLETQLKNGWRWPHDAPPRTAIERILPATSSQEALIAEMLRSGFKEYYNHDVVRLGDGVDLRRLRDAWQTIVDTTPILRTVFVGVDDVDMDVVFAQIVLKPTEVQVYDICIDCESGIDSVIDKLRASAVSGRATRAPLRLTVVHTRTDRYLILSLAHAQYDGHSLTLLHEDVQHAYEDTYSPRPSYDNAIEACLAATHEEALRFWRDTLSGAESCSIAPTTHRSVDEQTHRAEVTSSASAHTASSFCKTHAISMQALAQTCLALVLAQYTRRMEVLFGVVFACRDSEEAEQIMFPTMNTVPVRASLHGSRKQMLQYMQGIINDMLPYQKTPLRAIQATCGSVTKQDHGKARGGLFDTLFVYQHRPESKCEATQPLYESIGGRSSVEYPVAVELEAIGDKLMLRAACKDTVFDQKGTHQLLEDYDVVLNAVLNAPDEPTVDFKGPNTSICGLPSFELQTEGNVDDRKEDRKSDSGASAESVGLSPTVKIVKDVLAQVSKTSAEDISSTTTIESIGIDSISAIKVASLLRKQDIKLSVSEILIAKTPLVIAEVVDSRADGVPADGQMDPKSTIRTFFRNRNIDIASLTQGLKTSDIESVMPATAGQVYMLNMWAKSGGQLFYPTFTYRVAGGFDMDELRQAWSRLVRHHAVLRTVFCSTSEAATSVVQVILKEPVDSFSTSEEVAPSTSCQPMVSLRASRLDEGFELKLKIHHALYDAVSLPLLIGDFRGLLASLRPSRSSIKFEDFLALSLTSEAERKRKDFWTRYLANAKPVHIPQPATPGAQRRVEIFHPSLFTNCAALEAMARKEGVTVQSLLFAAYASIYARLAHTTTNEDKDDNGTDVVLGIYLSNRSHLPDLSSLAAPTLNLVPLLVRSPESTGLLECAKQIQQDLGEIGTAEHSAVGLWEIVEWTGIRVDTFVNFLKLPDGNEMEDKEDAHGKHNVNIEEASDRRIAARSQVVRPPAGTFEMPTELNEMKVADAYQVSPFFVPVAMSKIIDAYQHSVDIEATVANGELDMGIFCPESMLAQPDAEGVLEDVRKALEKLVGKSKA